MADLKTKETNGSVGDFLNDISDEKSRADCQKIAELMEKATGTKPKMYGASIVGFGNRILKYSNGRETDWMEIGFSPRKANLTLYLNIDESWNENLLSKLGKYKVGKGCLSFKRLSDVDEKILTELIDESVKNIRKK